MTDDTEDTLTLDEWAITVTWDEAILLDRVLSCTNRARDFSEEEFEKVKRAVHTKIRRALDRLADAHRKAKAAEGNPMTTTATRRRLTREAHDLLPPAMAAVVLAWYEAHHSLCGCPGLSPLDVDCLELAAEATWPLASWKS